MGRPGDNVDTDLVKPQETKQIDISIVGEMAGPEGTISEDKVLGAILEIAEKNGWSFGGSVSPIPAAWNDEDFED